MLLPILLPMVKVKCTGCEYEWDTKTNLERVTCPNCGVKVKVIKTEEIKKDGAGGSIKSN